MLTHHSIRLGTILRDRRVPYTGTQILLKNSEGAYKLHRIHPLSDIQIERIEGNLESVLIAPEEGEWHLSEIYVDDILFRVDPDVPILYKPVPPVDPDAVLEDQYIYATKGFQALQWNVAMVLSISAFILSIDGNIATSFLLGGSTGIVYHTMMQINVATLGKLRLLHIITSMPFRMSFVAVTAMVLSPHDRELFIATLGFLLHRVPLIAFLL